MNVDGGVRGPMTPRLDRLAAEGLRLNNFNVEFSCGMTLWEVTIAEALQAAGYAWLEDHASSFRTTLPLTSVKRKSRPWKR